MFGADYNCYGDAATLVKGTVVTPILFPAITHFVDVDSFSRGGTVDSKPVGPESG